MYVQREKVGFFEFGERPNEMEVSRLGRIQLRLYFIWISMGDESKDILKLEVEL